jgi:cobalt-zinc-cadmium efflux system outer membrane protein
MRARTILLLAFVLTTIFSPALHAADVPPAPAAAPDGTTPRAPTPGLGLVALEQLALQRNPTLVQAGAQVQISQGKSFQAGLWPNPNVGYSGELIGTDRTAGEFQGIFIEQQIITGCKLQLSRAKFSQEAREAELQVTAQQYRVLYGVRVAYYELLARQKRLALRRQLLKNAEEAVKTVQELINVGQANRPDLLRAELRMQRAKAALLAAGRRLEGSREALAAVVGDPQIAQSAIDGLLEFPRDADLERNTTLSQLLSSSPQLAVAEAEVARDQIGVQRESAEPIPNVLLRGAAGRNFTSDNTVGTVEIGLRLPLFDRNQGTILQAQAELSRARAEVTRRELELRRRFAQTFAQYEAALAIARTYQLEALPRAREMYQLYRQSFEKRRAAWPQVLDAEREYYELADEYLDNLLEARRAEALLSTYLLDDGLTQPPAPTPEGHREATPRPR